MDDVNGVTQCLIATNDSFTYNFDTIQYGTSWYHSHYSLQSADSLLGPITIHGPSSANDKEAMEPILMTEWGHRSSFEDFYLKMVRPKRTYITSALMNGNGTYSCTFLEGDAGNCTEPREKYSISCQEGKNTF